ncbi:multiubiquitin domain-containing protein [Sphingomonas panni]|uniref:multiubiquitin domain-containing protein n=1 Tax=Sphingomonas panni TaxID=237612 RepID=UPI001F5B52E8|nr:multiubiquitin domain-containing protein [Sphingomonas panni]
MYEDTDSQPDLPQRPGLPACLPRPAPPREIVVNGRRHLLRADHVDHGQLVGMAFPDEPSPGRNGNSLTVSYRGGPHNAPDGILAPNERTPLADGETFVVTRTDKS